MERRGDYMITKRLHLLFHSSSYYPPESPRLLNCQCDYQSREMVFRIMTRRLLIVRKLTKESYALSLPHSLSSAISFEMSERHRKTKPWVVSRRFPSMPQQAMTFPKKPHSHKQWLLTNMRAVWLPRNECQWLQRPVNHQLRFICALSPPSPTLRSIQHHSHSDSGTELNTGDILGNSIRNSRWDACVFLIHLLRHIEMTTISSNAALRVWRAFSAPSEACFVSLTAAWRTNTKRKRRKKVASWSGPACLQCTIAYPMTTFVEISRELSGDLEADNNILLSYSMAMS